MHDGCGKGQLLPLAAAHTAAELMYVCCQVIGVQQFVNPVPYGGF